MKTILVTGAGGYIGSVLVPKLLLKGYHVIAIDRFFFGKEKLQEHPNLKLIQEDVRKLEESHFSNVDAVIDLVAISNDPAGELFSEATWSINYKSRANTASLAKKSGVQQYILPSSCSLYGFQSSQVDETSPTNPLTTYAKANQKAEVEVLPLASQDFTVTVCRQATVFGVSPRMRFDLAINGMTHGAWKNHELPLMRDGSQYRPMVHVQDTTDVMILLLESPQEKINREIFNVGGESNNYQLGPLAETISKVVSSCLSKEVKINWYGDPDHRSYNVSFEKIYKTLGWQPSWNAEKGAREIIEALEKQTISLDDQAITLDWYKKIEKNEELFLDLKMYGGYVNITL